MGRWRRPTIDGSEVRKDEDFPEDPYDVPFMDFINCNGVEGFLSNSAIQRLRVSFDNAERVIPGSKESKEDEFLKRYDEKTGIGHHYLSLKTTDSRICKV